MANRVFLVENEFFNSLNLSLKNHIETSCRSVPGAKLKRCASFKDFLGSAEFQKGVVVVPLAAPDIEGTVDETLRTLQVKSPFPDFFALQFLLLCENSNFSPESLIELEWVEKLDSFYDVAVPTCFTAFYKDIPAVQTFQLAASVTSLLRQLDGLEELRKLSEAVTQLEKQISGTLG